MMGESKGGSPKGYRGSPGLFEDRKVEEQMHFGGAEFGRGGARF